MRLEETGTLDASPAEVWKVVSDPCRIGHLSELMTVDELEPDTIPEVGARYRVLLKVGAVPVGGNVEIIEYTPERELAWTTLTGVDHRLRLRLREIDGGDAEAGTRLVLRFGYDSPGFLGTFADVAAFVPVRSALRDLLDCVVREVEGP